MTLSPDDIQHCGNCVLRYDCGRSKAGDWCDEYRDEDVPKSEFCYPDGGDIAWKKGI